MATKKYGLIREVKRLDKKYNNKSKNKFIILESNDSNYALGYTGKKTKTGKYYKGSLGSEIALLSSYMSPGDLSDTLKRLDSYTPGMVKRFNKKDYADRYANYHKYQIKKGVVYLNGNKKRFNT